MSQRHFSPLITSFSPHHTALCVWRVFLIVLFSVLTAIFVSSCNPQASVEWENKQRTAMTEKLSSTFNDAALANSYKILTAQLNEIERENINSLLRIILDRSPSKADKSATVKAVLKGVTSVRTAESIRNRLPEALSLLLEIAEGTDASLLRLAEGVTSSGIENRLEYLKRSRDLVIAANKNEPFKSILEEKIPRVSAENMPTSVLFWDVVKEDASRENLLTLFWSIASFAAPADFELLVSKNTSQSARDSYFSALGKIKIDDANAGVFLKFINLVPLESLPSVGTLVGEYAKTQTAANVKTSILDAFRKGLTLQSSLAGSFATSAKNLLGKTETFVRLNGMASSVDAMRGEGFHTGVGFLNKFISDQEILICTLQGDSTEKVKYSFKWNKNESLLIDWTTPGSERKHASQIFALGDRPQCFVRVYIDDAKAFEVEGELVTVGSSPPEFVSGRVPADGAETVAQGGVLSYNAENAIDANPGDSVIYRITAQAAQGSVVQTGLNQFEYRPIVSFFGQDQFRYQACDQTGICSAEKKVIVTVTQANQPPQIFGVAGSAVNDATKTIFLAEDISSTPASVPVNYLVAADDDTEPVMCSSVLQITSRDETKLLNSASQIEILGTFPQCSFKLYPEINAFGAFKIRVKLTDAESAFTVKDVDVFITNINDAPTISSIATQSTQEDATSTAIALSINDSDGPTRVCNSANISYSVAPNNNLISAAGAVSFGGTWPNCTATVSPVANQSGSSQLTFTATDGSLSGSSNAFTFNVAAVNDLPVLTANAATTHTEGSGATVIDAALTVADVDDTNIESALVKITDGRSAGDLLEFTDQSSITGSYDASSGTLTLSGSASLAAYETALRSVRFNTSNDNPTQISATRKVTWQVGDGDGSSNVPFSTITVQGTNDVPVVVAAGTLAYSENGPAAFVDSGLTITDPDNTTLANATVSIVGAPFTGDVLGVADAHGIVVNFNPTTGVLSLTGTRSVADYQAALRSVTYRSSSDDPGSTRQITWVVNDGTGASTAVTSTVSITASNDLPTVVAGGNLAYSEGGAAVAIDGTMTIADLDNASLNSATITVSAGFTADDILGFTPQNNISLVSYSGGVLTISGVSSVANYQAALRSITFNSTSDHPTATSATRTISWVVNDGAGNSMSVNSTINITASNDAPTMTAGSNAATFTEGAAAVAIDTTLTLVDPDNTQLTGATVSITAGLTAGDSLNFTNQPGIVGAYNSSTGELVLTGTATLANYETALEAVTFSSASDNPGATFATRTVSWRVSDGTSNATAVTSTVNIAGDNDTSVITAGATLAYTENGSASAIDAGIVVTDIDSANLVGATITLSSGFTTGDEFSFTTQNGISVASNSGGALTLTGTTTIANYQAALRTVAFRSASDTPTSTSTSRTVSWMVNDGTGNSAAATSTINITAVNDVPTLTTGGTAAYTEKAAATVLDNGITVADADHANLASATVSISSGFVAGDVLGFTNQNSITGAYSASTGVLTLTGVSSVANYETALRSVTFSSNVVNPTASRTISWTVSDGTSSSTAGTSNLTFTSVPDAPVLTAGGALNYAENSAAGLLDAGINISDVDSSQLSLASVSITSGFVVGDTLAVGNDQGTTVAFNSATGVLTLSGAKTLAEYQTALRSVTFVTNSDNPTMSRTVTWIVTDSTSTASAAVTSTITITPSNDAPTVTASGTTAYGENDPAVTINTGLTVADLDNDNLASATVSISNGFVSGDTLGFANQNGITGWYNAAAGVLTLTGSDLKVNYQIALRSVTFASSSNNPGSARTISWVVNDGTASSTAVTSAITITPSNDVPVVTAGGTLAYSENGATANIDTALTISDDDSANLSSATITVTNRSIGDILGFTSQNGITGTFDAATGVLALTGTATVAQYQAVLRTVTYRSTSDDPTGASASRTISWVVNDGTAASTAVTSTVNITASNDAPTMTAGGTLAYAEGGAAAAIDASVVSADLDNASLSGATVTIASGLTTGDVLGFSPQNGITVTSNTGGVLTLGGVASVANYQAALRSVTYFSTSDHPTATSATRTVSWVVNDGTDNSAAVTSTINITASNDAPIMTAGANTASFTEGGAAAVIDTTLTLNDVDNTQITGATVSITAGLTAGDSLNFTNQSGIVGAYNSATGALVLSGTATLANYEAALESVTFSSSSDNPTATSASRTISWQVVDGVATSAAVTSTVNVTGIVDAPVATAGGSLSYTENAAAAAIDSGIVLTDADSVNINSATITISNGLTTGDELSFTAQTGISVNSNSGGILTLTGTATVANYQTALRTVAFRSTSENPTGTSATRTVSWVVNDGNVNSTTVTSTINITAVNDVPTITTGGAAAYTEKAAATVMDNGITVTDADHANLASATVSISSGFVAGDVLGFTNQNSITGAYNASTGVLTLTGGSSVANYETALRSVTFSSTTVNPTASRTISWTVSDGTSSSTVATSNLTFTSVADAPVLTAGGALSYAENSAAGVLDAGINISDVDSSQLSLASVSITSGFVAGDTLAVSNDQGTTVAYNATTGVLTLSGAKTLAEYQTALRSVTFLTNSDNPTTTRTVTWIVTDSTSTASAAVTSTITIAPSNDAPTITAGGTTAYGENDPAVTINTGVTVADLDNDNLAAATVSISSGFVSGDALGFSNQSGITGTYNASTGVMSLAGSATKANYQTALRSITFASSANSPGANRTISWAVNDGTVSSTAVTSAIAITASNDVPVVTAGGTLAYAENGAAVSVDNSIVVTDDDNANLSSATITVTNRRDGDLLGFTNQNGITGVYDAATGVLSLSGTATVANYQSALRSVTYRSTSDDPTAVSASRTISWVVDDGTGASAAATSTVNITASNDLPTVTAGGTLAYAEGGAAAAIDATVVAADLDNASFSSATVTISSGLTTGDVLGFIAQNGITVTSNTGGVLTLGGMASVANYQAALRSVTFYSTSENPTATATTRTITWVVNDGTVNSGAVTSTINITASNDAPIMTAGANTASFTEGGAAVIIDNTLTLNDADSTQITGATVSITSGLTAGDSLNFTAQSGIVGAYNSATGVLVLLGTATLANYETALESVTFSSSSDNPTATSANRTASWQVSDGTATSTAVTSIVNVAGVNDAPAITAGGSLSYTENGAAAAIDAGVVVTDIDSTNISGATITISNGLTTGDELSFAAQNGISVVSNVGGVLTLTGTSTIANYQAALRTVAFRSTSENPTATSVARTITWTVSDGSLNSGGAQSTILISPTNDAPTGTPTCDTLSSGNVFRTGLAAGAGWNVGTCAGATDIDGDALTYRLDLAETGGNSSASYSCPTPIS
ncbi:MAG: cell surface protein required for swimming motility, partial [Pseudomonadota bacterium]